MARTQTKKNKTRSLKMKMAIEILTNNEDRYAAPSRNSEIFWELNLSFNCLNTLHVLDLLWIFTSKKKAIKKQNNFQIFGNDENHHATSSRNFSIVLELNYKCHTGFLEHSVFYESSKKDSKVHYLKKEGHWKWKWPSNPGKWWRPLLSRQVQGLPLWRPSCKGHMQSNTRERKK